MLAMLLLGSAAAARAIDPQATAPDIVAQTWTKRDGLPTNSLKALEASPDGYIWIGSEKGVTRFDGVRFTPLDPRRFPALENAVVSDISATAADRLYISTFSGVLLYDGQRVTPLTVRDHPQLPVLRVRRGSNMEMWGVFEGGFGMIEGHELVPFVSPALDGLGGGLDLIGIDDDGRLLIDTPKGLSIVDQDKATAVKWEDGRPVMTPLFVYAPGGGLWIGEDGHELGVWDGKVLRRDPQVSSITGRKFVFAYRQRDRQATWLGVVPRGLFRARLAENGKFVLDDVSNLAPALQTELEEVIEDSSGQLWFATSGQGLVRVADASVSMYSPANGLPSKAYTGLGFDRNGKPWLLHAEGICDASTTPARCYGSESGLPPTTIISGFCPESDGSLLLGTIGQGVVRFSNERASKTPPEWSALNKLVLDIHREVDGTLVITGFSGLTLVAPDGSVTHVPFSPAAGAATQARRDASGRYWVGTFQDGLYLLDDGAPRPVSPTRETRTLVNQLLLHGDYMYVGTMAGIQIWQGEKMLRLLDEAHGLGQNNVMSFVDAGDTLWVGHNDGVSPIAFRQLEQFARGELEAVDKQVLSVEEGLLDGEVHGGSAISAALAPDGRVWFSSGDGFAVVNTTRLSKSIATATPRFEEMLCDGVPYPTTEPSTLPAGTRQCSFRFTALDHPQPRRLIFQYQLDQQPVTEIGSQREVVLAGLRPGARRLAVTAALPGGQWSRPAIIDFRVRPYFWQAWWFYLGLVLLTVAAMYGLHRLRIRRVVELERIRTRIASDLHDDLGSSLSRISILSEVAKRGSGETAGHALDTIGNTARELIDQTSDIVWSIDPRRDDLQSVITRVQSFAADVLGSRGVTMTFEVPEHAESVRLLPDRRRALYLLAKEALHNIAKHANAHAVRVSLAIDARSARLAIHDDGVGFDQAAPAPAGASMNRGGHGIESMKTRAQALGGRCEISSQRGAGTTVRVDLPI